MSRPPRPNPFVQLPLAWTLLRQPTAAVMEIWRRWGPVVRLGYGPTAYTYLLGRDANELILSTRPDAFEWAAAFETLVPIDGPTALVVSDGDIHRRRRRLVQPAFSTKRIHGYLPVMIDELDRTIASWQPGSEIELHSEAMRTIRRIVIRALFGDRLRARADEIGDLLEPALDFVQRPPPLQLRRGRAWHRLNAGRDAVTAIVFDEIAARRREAVDHGDVLDALIAARDEDGSTLTDEEVRDQVISLVAAGYHTTSAAAAWTSHALLAHEDVWDRVCSEVREVVGDAPLAPDDVGRLPYVAGVVHESLRLWPPGFASGRKVVADVELGGFTVPAGQMVLWSPWVTHRDPALWPDPDRFAPGRWIPGDADHHDVEPYSFVPFGGGYRRCIGFSLATLEVTAWVVRLAQRVRIDLVSADVRPAGFATTYPHPGVRARVVERRAALVA